VIYSALIGAYDAVPQPTVSDERFDFVLFSNCVEASTDGVWQIRPIAYENTDTTRIARYVKTHPETLLPEYDVSIWVDMNVLIKTGYLYERAAQLVSKGILISSMHHPGWDCIYEEAFAVMHMRVERESVVLGWCHQLVKEGYPRHNGLCETNVLFRQHNKPEVADFDGFWWECICAHSRRDQLSFNYALWKKGIPCHYMMGEETCAKNSEDFEVIKHKDGNHNFCDLAKNEGWLMRYCWKVPSQVDKIKGIYYKIYSMLFPKTFAFLLGQYFRVKYLLFK
jgi:hypothetical protein